MNLSSIAVLEDFQKKYYLGFLSLFRAQNNKARDRLKLRHPSLISAFPEDSGGKLVANL